MAKCQISRNSYHKIGTIMIKNDAYRWQKPVPVPRARPTDFAASASGSTPARLVCFPRSMRFWSEVLGEILQIWWGIIIFPNDKLSRNFLVKWRRDANPIKSIGFLFLCEFIQECTSSSPNDTCKHLITHFGHAQHRDHPLCLVKPDLHFLAAKGKESTHCLRDFSDRVPQTWCFIMFSLEWWPIFRHAHNGP